MVTLREFDPENLELNSLLTYFDEQNRLIGVDTFYLYDTGCTDDTLEVLAPWIEAGIVKLHQFDEGWFNSFGPAAFMVRS